MQENNNTEVSDLEKGMDSNKADEPKLSGKLFIFTALVILAVIATLSYSDKGTDSQDGVETYRSEELGFEIQYPDELNLIADNQGVAITHSVAHTFNDPCDLRDGSSKLDKMIDFNADLRVFDKSIEATVKDSYVSWSDIMENGQFKISPGFVDAYLVGSLSGYRLSIGAEGCGLNTYYFPLSDSSTLVVTQKISPERTPLISNYEEFLSLPEAISPQEENDIFNQILGTFKVISTK